MGKRFYVEASNDPDPKTGKPAFARYMSDRDGAMRLGEELRYAYRWIAEFGEYVARDGSRTQDWIYFWWSPNDLYGEVPPAGRGLRESDVDAPFVSYTPLDTDD